MIKEFRANGTTFRDGLCTCHRTMIYDRELKQYISSAVDSSRKNGVQWFAIREDDIIRHLNNAESVEVYENYMVIKTQSKEYKVALCKEIFGDEK